jgi:hypothetical protein
LESGPQPAVGCDDLLNSLPVQYPFLLKPYEHKVPVLMTRGPIGLDAAPLKRDKLYQQAACRSQFSLVIILRGEPTHAESKGSPATSTSKRVSPITSLGVHTPNS